MMLDREKRECLKILEYLSMHDIFCLANTVTNGIVRPESRGEACNVIVKFSVDADEFLHRKKINRNALFLYLSDIGHAVPVNNDKHLMIQKILGIWKSDVLERPEPIREKFETPIVKRPVPEQQTEINLAQQIAIEFSKWFYPNMNSINPFYPRDASNSFGPAHFWENSTLNLHYQDTEERIEGASLISQRLIQLIHSENIIFVPNVDDPKSIQGRMDPHGLVIVCVAGTVQKNNLLVGVFEQIFGLAKDHLVNDHYKIKQTDLNLRSSSQQQLSPPPMMAAVMSY